MRLPSRMALMWPGQTLAGEDRAGLRSTPCSIRCRRWRAASSSAARSAARSKPTGTICEVLIVGTGGLSHQLDGKRAGFINKEFDLLCMDKIANDPEALTRYSIPNLVEQAGAQGVELLNWMAMRGALTGRVSEVHRNYHIPISNTAAATIVRENATVARLAA